MIIFRALWILRQSDQTDLDAEKGWERAKSIHEYIFVTLESSVLLGALSVAIDKSASAWLLHIVYVIGYGGLGLYLMAGANYAIAAISNARGWSVATGPAPWVIGIVGWIIAMSIPYFLSAIVSGFIANNIGL